MDSPNDLSLMTLRSLVSTRNTRARFSATAPWSTALVPESTLSGTSMLFVLSLPLASLTPLSSDRAPFFSAAPPRQSVRNVGLSQPAAYSQSSMPPSTGYTSELMRPTANTQIVSQLSG